MRITNDDGQCSVEIKSEMARIKKVLTMNETSYVTTERLRKLIRSHCGDLAISEWDQDCTPKNAKVFYNWLFGKTINLEGKGGMSFECDGVVNTSFFIDHTICPQDVTFHHEKRSNSSFFTVYYPTTDMKNIPHGFGQRYRLRTIIVLIKGDPYNHYVAIFRLKDYSTNQDHWFMFNGDSIYKPYVYIGMDGDLIRYMSVEISEYLVQLMIYDENDAINRIPLTYGQDVTFTNVQSTPVAAPRKKIVRLPFDDDFQVKRQQTFMTKFVVEALDRGYKKGHLKNNRPTVVNMKTLFRLAGMKGYSKLNKNTLLDKLNDPNYQRRMKLSWEK